MDVIVMGRANVANIAVGLSQDDVEALLHTSAANEESLLAAGWGM